MQVVGINVGFLLVQLLSIILLIGLPIISLIDLSKKKLSGAPLAIWALLICAVPILGALAYWIVKPTAETRN
ncbi:MAG: transcriptional regulator [Chloroflexota bacterium]|nr:PLDc N-terminal domain-containing protein [Chloroflexota bacterium]MBI5705239.1 PLDc N-terminal domain-containing protein [Chloroflexota bacterium]